jgi:serine/threonine-protein kinase
MGPADDVTHSAHPPESSDPAVIPTASSEGTPERIQRLNPGTNVQRYVILQHLGEGGMGEVYTAFDPTLDRKLALKLVKAGARAAGKQQRLLREAQATARIVHPNVITIYDSGVWSDDVFVAMEFVDGRTLTQWINEKPRTWREIVDVFIEAGEGLVAAHEAGLIHRDFKPSNVLIRRDGRVVVIDFGLAETAATAVPDTLSTAAAEASSEQPAHVLVGTPPYMSPEQHSNHPADARSDQFNYCAALFHVLCRVPPFAAKNLNELLEQKRQFVLQPLPSETKIPAWLYRAIRRGLSPKRAERWPSMAALLGELRQRRHGSRRRTTTTLTACLILGTVVATAGIWGARRDQSALCHQAATEQAVPWETTERQAVRAGFQRSGAPYWEETWARVESGITAYNASWKSAYVDACEATNVRQEQSGALLDLRMACLKRRRAATSALVELLGKADEALVAKSVQLAGDLERLEHCSDQVALMREWTAVEAPQDPQAVQAVDEQFARLLTYDNAGRFSEGLALATVTLDKARTLHYPPAEAEAYYWCGRFHDETSDFETSQKDFETALAMAIRAKADRLALMSAIQLVHVVGFRQTKLDQGIFWSNLAEALLTRLGGDRMLQAALLERTGSVLELAGQFEEANKNLYAAIQIRTDLLGALHPSLSESWMRLAILHARRSKFSEAEPAFRKALQIAEASLGPGHPQVVRALGNLSTSISRRGGHEEALHLQERALMLAAKAFGERNRAYTSIIHNMGVTYRFLGEFEKSRDTLGKAHRLDVAVSGEDSLDVTNGLTELGVTSHMLGQYHEAEGYLLEALKRNETTLGAKHPYVGEDHLFLGDLYRAQGQLQRARNHYQQALTIYRASGDPEAAGVGEALAGLGLIDVEAHRFASARNTLEQALSILRHDRNDPLTLYDVNFGLAKALYNLGGADSGNARKLAQEALQGYMQAPRRRAASRLAAVQSWLDDKTR